MSVMHEQLPLTQVCLVFHLLQDLHGINKMTHLKVWPGYTTIAAWFNRPISDCNCCLVVHLWEGQSCTVALRCSHVAI